ncbi:hypothetical protein [Paraburkholderia lacunae]|uniref:Uncharacterized protein n=1 Tax=Paraburkholderia lacunae TaxID=2211104 RepID=A0A370NBZ9_9BURK|nr:hypothetical protein [Paraburkholderia lacunae]RDK03123.1 hypothetical protein DLM46_09540 [Paraburkholderia lacunae]
MSAINVLIVADGNRFTFDPTSTTTEGVFTINAFIGALQASTDPVFTVAKAHRRGATNHEQHVTIPGNFTFTPADLTSYDVMCLFGDEGYNDGGLEPGSSPLMPDELIAIADFMESGGGVFAVGDHDGLGAYMCGDIPRVRTMRKWYEAEHPRAGFPSNWSTGGIVGGETRLLPRTDTLRPDSADGKFYFYGQSDPTPQPITAIAPVHPVLQGPSGTITQFPDHMHEGEAITAPAAFLTGPQITYNGATLGTRSFTEYPNVAGHQETPRVVATVTEIPGHTTVGQGGAYTSVATDTPPKTIGAISAYDGYNAGVGRVLTGSTFHHYMDINVTGDPTSASTTPGVGPTNSNLGLPPDALNGMLAYYVNAVMWLSRLAKTCSLWVDKSTFGVDEVEETKTYGDAFWVVLDGFSPSELGSTVPTFSGAFAGIVGASGIIAGTPVFENMAAQWMPQRILIPCTIKFPASALSAFPTGSAGPFFELLQANILLGGTSYSAQADIELVAGADPYFNNVDPTQDNVFWLSQDLRVFTLTAGTNPPSVAGATLSTANPTMLDANAGYAFVQQLITNLNSGYSDPGGTDPFASVLPNQSGALTGDSSVTPHDASGNINYNFAVARVRLSGGPTGSTASNVRVFFRMFLTQSNDTDFQPTTTYASNPDAQGRPGSPVSDAATDTIPFFATGNYPSINDYAGLNVNNRPVSAGAGGHVWAYFGCFLNVYDTNNVVNNQSVPSRLMGTHHCIVAEIAYDGAPIVNTNGVTMSPENSDKLAQRNLQVTASDNPGASATHRIPQTFDLRPSRPVLAGSSELLDLPDELMIDWGNTPVGSTASIYWPQVDAAKVLKLATRMYPVHQLSASDAHTLQCPVTAGATYVPIPPGAGQNFAGLFTVDLPPTVVKGQAFRIVVRRVSTRQVSERTVNAQQPGTRARVGVNGDGRDKAMLNWRYVVGTFQVTIPVSTHDVLLEPEENTLAIMKWRLSQTAPSDRWYPVLQRYISYLAGRVNGLGGNAGSIEPSPLGVPPKPAHVHVEHTREFTGKVSSIGYDRFGDFDGFRLLSEDGCEHTFRSCEHAVEDVVRCAWRERDVITVIVHRHELHVPVSIVLRRAPRLH